MITLILTQLLEVKMKLKVNTIITLENNKRYVVLNETTWQEKKYFLVMEVAANKEVIPENVAIFESIEDISATFIEKVNDPEMITLLTNQLKAQL